MAVKRSAPARVLLVDDNAALVDNLKEILEDAGYEVRAAESCATALESARRGFHVALVDLRLPDGEGTALATELKRVSPDSEVILLTGFATLESAAAAVRAGAWAYLVKPCSTPDLLLAVDQAMKQVRAQEEKRELERRAQVAEKLAAVGTMTAGLSHEIRNPLNAATLQLTVLERRLRKLPETQQPPLLEPLALVRDEVRRLDHILEDFLQFARPRELQLCPVALNPLVCRVADFLQAQADRKEIRIARELSHDPTVVADESRLQQVLMNLILNAIQATPSGGAVALKTFHEGPDCLLVIEDTGPGVPGELRDRIFEPFFTTKATGSGLGLPIVHAIITQHGGHIALSQSETAGARFTIRLPAAS